MKYLLIFLVFIGISCSIDKTLDPIDTNSEYEIEQRSQSLIDHENIAKIFSQMTTSQVFRTYIVGEINNSPVNTYNSVSLLSILTGRNACTFNSEYTTAANTLRLESYGINYFITDYLDDYPGLSISVYVSDLDAGGVLPSQNDTIPVFSEMIYDEFGADYQYKLYKSGLYLQTTTDSGGPDFVVLVLQIKEGFVILDNNQVNDTTYFDNNSRVRFCSDLVTEISNNLNYNSTMQNTTITLCGTVYNNPFKDFYFVTNEEITNEYHNTCITLPPSPPPTSPPALCIAERTTWNNTVNEEEVTQVKMPAGNDLLELNHDWCAWWNRNCRLQLDLIVSDKFSTTEFVSYQPGPYFGWFNEYQLKKKIFVVPESPIHTIPWHYESGKHGEEWKYSWVGKHRRSGDEVTHGLSNSLSQSINFKDTILGGAISLGLKLGTTVSVKYTMKDLVIGGDPAFFCDDILVNNNKGTKYSTGDLEFNVREEE